MIFAVGALRLDERDTLARDIRPESLVLAVPSAQRDVPVQTDLAVFDFDDETRRMRAIALNPGVSCEQVQANTGFPLAFAPDLREPKHRSRGTGDAAPSRS